MHHRLALAQFFKIAFNCLGYNLEADLLDILLVAL